MIRLALIAFLLWRFIRRMDWVDEQDREDFCDVHLPRLHCSHRGIA